MWSNEARYGQKRIFRRMSKNDTSSKQDTSEKSEVARDVLRAEVGPCELGYQMYNRRQVISPYVFDTTQTINVFETKSYII